MEIKTKETAEYLILLLRTVLNGEEPLEKPEGITFDELYHLAKFHQVSCMSYYAIEKLEKQPEQEKNRKWRSERDQHIVKSMVQLSERDFIIERLTDAGIDILPLKGCLLKEMYPQDDYREMADLDILVDADKAALAREQMEALGYTAKYFDVSNHDNYEKLPFMGVELHRHMISEKYETHQYYKDVWKKAVPDDSREHCFHFSWNDYYLFLLIHFAKHYYGGGSGIRSIMDIYVFLSRHKQELDQTYLKKELRSLHLEDFKETAECLAECWFGNGKYTLELEEMMEYVITSGVYGTYQREIENRIKNAEQKSNSVFIGRISYFFSRIFLNYKTMCSLYPMLKKIPALLPVFWVLRLLSALLRKRNRVRIEWNNIIRKKEKES